MVPRISKLDNFQIASAPSLPRSPTARTRSPAPYFSGALAPAALFGLLALPAAAAGLDPAKVNADPTAQRMLEAIDAAHHLRPLGTLAHFVLAADRQGQTCTLADKGNDIFMMECAPTPQRPKYSLLLTGENGRLLAVSMYGADGHLLPTSDAFERLTAVAPVQPETTVPPPASADDGNPLLSSVAPQGSTFWTYERDGRKISLGTVAELDAAIGRKGGKCTIGQVRGETGAGDITCRSPGAGGDRDADELEIAIKYGTTCLTGRDCYEVRDIKLNDRRLTHAQFLQFVGRTTVPMSPDPLPSKGADPDAFLPGLPHSVDLANGTDATTRFWASGYDSRRSDLGSASDLDAAIARKGGRCVIGPALGGSGSATGASQIVCRFPKAANPSPDAADELVLEASFSHRDCLHGGRNCYEIRDIALNDERLTHAQYLQLISGQAQKDPNASKFDPFAPAPGAPLKTYVAKDACLFTTTQVAGHPMKVDIGSLYPLDAALRKAGGRCYFDETNAGHMTLTCHYPDTRRQTMHELALEGDNDNAGCYGVDNIKLDDKPLPYVQYNQIFVQHR